MNNMKKEKEKEQDRDDSGNTEKKRASKSLPTYDCGGALHIKFSIKREAINVVYKHNPIHGSPTVNERYVAQTEPREMFFKCLTMSAVCFHWQLSPIPVLCHPDLQQPMPPMYARGSPPKRTRLISKMSTTTQNTTYLLRPRVLNLPRRKGRTRLHQHLRTQRKQHF
jgi:hypothetical protein